MLIHAATQQEIIDWITYIERAVGFYDYSDFIIRKAILQTPIELGELEINSTIAGSEDAILVKDAYRKLEGTGEEYAIKRYIEQPELMRSNTSTKFITIREYESYHRIIVGNTRLVAFYETHKTQSSINFEVFLLSPR